VVQLELRLSWDRGKMVISLVSMTRKYFEELAIPPPKGFPKLLILIMQLMNFWMSPFQIMPDKEQEQDLIKIKSRK
jgi:hypothetical protein